MNNDSSSPTDSPSDPRISYQELVRTFSGFGVFVARWKFKKSRRCWRGVDSSRRRVRR